MKPSWSESNEISHSYCNECVCGYYPLDNSSSYNIYITSTVGNKDDDPDRKVVLTEDAQKFAEQMGIQHFETSAKENINVEEVCTFYLFD